MPKDLEAGKGRALERLARAHSVRLGHDLGTFERRPIGGVDMVAACGPCGATVACDADRPKFIAGEAIAQSCISIRKQKEGL